MKKSPKSAKFFASHWSAFLQQFKNLHLRGDRFVMLTVAGLINAFGVSVFLYPVNLYDSGISGTAMLLAQITPDWCSLSLILLLLNVPLFLFGLKRQGVQFTIYAVYSVFIYSLGAWLIQGPLPLDVSISSPLAGTDLLLCALFGGLISGVGSGLAIRGGGAMDGMEVMAVIFARKLGMTVGTFVMSYNVVLYILAGLLRSSWILPPVFHYRLRRRAESRRFCNRGHRPQQSGADCHPQPGRHLPRAGRGVRHRYDVHPGAGRFFARGNDDCVLRRQPLPNQPDEGHCARP